MGSENENINNGKSCETEWPEQSPTFHRGREVITILGNVIYVDTLDPTVRNIRPCGNCGSERTIEGHDSCLGELQGVMNACCGHGVPTQAYVQIDRKNIVEGIEAIKLIEKLKKV